MHAARHVQSFGEATRDIGFAERSESVPSSRSSTASISDCAASKTASAALAAIFGDSVGSTNFASAAMGVVSGLRSACASATTTRPAKRPSESSSAT